MSKWRWLFLQLARLLWLRAALFALLGGAAAALALLADRGLPWKLPFDIGTDAVDSILSIIASSMLAVTTFSVSVMITSFGAATTNVTPRATKLLMQDRIAQNVLSTFIGSFLFSIVGLVAVQAGAYGPEGRAVLFIVTIGVIAWIVISLLRWIDHLTRLGRVGETTDRVEEAAKEAIEMRLEEPYLGGRRLDDAERQVPESAIAVTAAATGYILYVDMAALSQCAEKIEADIYLDLVPGKFAYHHTALARIDTPSLPDDDEWDKVRKRVRGAFTISDERSFDQDPRFGLSVLSEIALRALSPGINDPGTAIDVIGRATRLLTIWAEGDREPTEIEYPRIHVPPIEADDLFDDAFRLIARDGAAQLDVQLRLRKALRALSQMGTDDFRRAAREQARLALKRAEKAIELDEDLQRLTEIDVPISPAELPALRAATGGRTRE